jgi:hypothetical protein
MSGGKPNPSLDDVLNTFSVESTPDVATLERYLHRYPQFAEDLVDLFRELHRFIPIDDNPATPEEAALIDAAWRAHTAAAPAVSDPLAALTVEQLRTLATALEVPRQVVAAIRERRVIFASVPKRILRVLAEGASCTVETLAAALAGPLQGAAATSHKANEKPTATGQVTFEQILIDAGVPAETRARLLKDD